MYPKERKWGLIATLIGMGVLILVATRLLTGSTETKTAIIPENKTQNIQADANGMNRKGTADIEARITSIEQRLEQLVNQLESVSTSPGSSQKIDSTDIEKRVESLAKQLNAMAKETPQEKRLEKELEIAKFQAAANDPVLRQKYMDFIGNQQKEQLEHITNLFENEPVDGAWATDNQTQIETAFNNTESLASATLLSSDCRTSMCHFEVAVPSGGDGSENDQDLFILENELVAAVSQKLKRSTIQRHPDGQGGHRFEIYLFREDYEIPRIPNPLEGKSISEAIDYFIEQ